MTGRCALVALLLTAALQGTRADCSGSDLGLVIDSGSWHEYCCTQMDGTQDVSYYAKFYSVNNDAYTTQSVVADDSGATGHCAGSAAGPPDWMPFVQRSYTDNFVHTEQYYDGGTGGTYTRTQISFRVGCTTPGSGSQCQIVIDKLNQCNGRSCGASQAMLRNNVTDASRDPGQGVGTVMYSSAALTV